MKKMIIPVMLAALLLCGCSGRSASGDEVWTLPTIEPAPTVPPTPTPARTDNNLAPEQYIWNEAAGVNMSDPGAAEGALPGSFSHSESFALFGGQFLPDALFYESYAAFDKLNLQKSEHQVLVDGNGELAENAYVEYKYLPRSRDEDKGLTVMAELCGYDAVLGVYGRTSCPHFSFPEDVKPQSSVYYLNYFVLAKVGETRYAQWLVLPSAYFSYAEAQQAKAEDQGEEPVIQRQVLLTFTCGPDMSDEEFIAAVRDVFQYGFDNRSVPREVAPTLAPGDKGYA